MNTISSCIILLVVFFVHVEAGKTKLPSGMSQHLYCTGCIATVTELEKLIARRHLTPNNRESKIMEMIEKICNAENFVEYDYSPPKMERACKEFLDNHEESLENALVQNKPNVQQLVCYDASDACADVDVSKKMAKSKLADLDLSDTKSKTLKVDPKTQQYTVEGGDSKKVTKETKGEAKTLSKKDKKKKEKKKTATKKTATKEKKSGGKQKGNINHINLDINDPQSMEKVMAQIKEMTQQDAKQMDPVKKKKTKEEL